MKIGYARVSTDEQNLALQLDALRGAGCELVHEDKASGVLADRKGLTEALKGCAAGDVLVVWKLDRLARSLHDLVVIAADLKGRGVGLKILTGEGAAVDTTQPQAGWSSAFWRSWPNSSGTRCRTHPGRDSGRQGNGASGWAARSS